MVTLERCDQDDPDFLELAGLMITNSGQVHHVCAVHIVHVDNWFGERWFTFAGKLMGQLGTWSRWRGPRENRCTLQIPPFHPHRVLSERRYELTQDGTTRETPTVQMIHDKRSSESNTRLERAMDKAGANMVFAWYSGNTLKTRRASLMIYVQPAQAHAFGWYVGLQNKGSWRATRKVNLGDLEWERLLTPIAASR